MYRVQLTLERDSAFNSEPPIMERRVCVYMPTRGLAITLWLILTDKIVRFKDARHPSEVKVKTWQDGALLVDVEEES